MFLTSVSRKPKTHKGKNELIRRGPKLIEDIKLAICVKGNKTTETTRDCLRDLVCTNIIPYFCLISLQFDFFVVHIKKASCHNFDEKE